MILSKWIWNPQQGSNKKDLILRCLLQREQSAKLAQLRDSLPLDEPLQPIKEGYSMQLPYASEHLKLKTLSAPMTVLSWTMKLCSILLLHREAKR